MNQPLRILHLEDDPDYCDLVRSLLEREGIRGEITLVEGWEAFESALASGKFDLILADYLLPSCNGLDALRLARERSPETPFLLVSGTIGEQAAIESLRTGATDYVLKHWPDRLVPAVRRAVEEAGERSQRRQIEAELVRREKYFRTLTENALDILSILDRDGHFIHNSPSVKRVLGYDPQELAGKRAFAFLHPDDLPRVLQAFRCGVANAERPVTVEFRVRTRDGSWRYLEAVGQSRLHDPDIAGIVVNSRDVSDRKQAEIGLTESEQQYRLVFHGSPVPMYVFDHETLAFLEVNDAALEHYGYSREEFLSMKLQDIRPQEEVPALIEYLHTLLAPDQPIRPGLVGSWRHRKKDGTLMDVEIKWSPISFRGRVASMSMVNDITERKRNEHRDAAFSKLGQDLSSATSPAEAARIIRAVTNDLFNWDAFTLNLYSAEQGTIQRILGVDTDREGGRFDIPLTGQAGQPSQMARRVAEHGAELILREEPITMPTDSVPIGDTSRPSASLMLAPIRNRTKVIGILSIQSYAPKAYTRADLNMLQTLADHCAGALERIRAEQALRDSEQRFRELIEASPDAVFVEDLEGNVLDVNPAACRLHEMTAGELVGKNAFDLVPPEQREKAAREFKALAEGRLGRIEGASRTRDGRFVPVEIRAGRVNYAGQQAVLLHVRDITDRKLAETALRSSELLFHSVWENSADGMRLTNEQGNIVAVNKAFCKIVGRRREELEGQSLTALHTGSEPPGKMLQEYIQRLQGRVTEREQERRLTLRDGNLVIMEETSSFVELRGRPPLLLGIFRDVTAQKRLEEQLRQSQKMDAIGQLAGGVAHDFNNILTVIHGHASLLIAGGSLKPGAAKSAQQITQAAERAAGLTRQLLAFGRRQVMQPRLLDLNELVANMTKMLSRILGEDIALQLNYLPQPALVHADGGMLEQVLLNLSVNSRDAMPRGGQLTIKISGFEADAKRLVGQPVPCPNGVVCLSVADTGCGIPPENVRRIFEPFFTTKEVGKGTGLGLATVYGIVQQHRGWIEVESEPGQGSTFKVFLPRSLEPAKPANGPSTEPTVRGGTETILVVEDEAAVRELVCEFLTRHGYRILQADSGAKALQVWRESKDRIDLLLTDLVMPGQLNGRELAEELRAERPRLKVIFTSGYSADVVGKDFVLRRGLHHLQKPYHPRTLAKVVRDCLDAVN
ncbi:MAG TPA: PAS domain S-box protein [Candidatus Paceibacterota bacterium]|nr:PAS domain S-box protein [Verrucomicrobiota bacterium]HSA10482.1 PAS domain S-box protein [Candidatus Paceibacterota bacterium]